jgi:hypothetical protein
LLILSLVLIPLVIFLLLLFPWLAASYGVEKKGDKIKQRKVDSQVMGELIYPCFFPWSLPGD